MIVLDSPAESKITELRELIANFKSEPLAKYPGVTRVLSATKDQTGLDAWKERVGHEEAERIIEESKAIGTSLDTIFNDSLTKPDFDLASYGQEPGVRLFRQFERNVKKITPIAVQMKVWSDQMGIMGYLDCLGYYNGELSLIDCKNAKREKTEEHLLDYYLQCAAYSMCLSDMLGISVKQIVLLIARRDQAIPQIAVKRTKDYVHEVLKRVNDYKRNQ